MLSFLTPIKCIFIKCTILVVLLFIDKNYVHGESLQLLDGEFLGAPPERRGKEDRVIRLHKAVVDLFGSFPTSSSTFGAEALLTIDASCNLVPEFEEEASVIGLVDDGLRVVAEVLKEILIKHTRQS